MKLTSSDSHEIERLSKSPSFQRLANSILVGLDRDTLAEYLAGYMYFKSQGRTYFDFGLFVATRMFKKTVALGIRVAAAVIPGLLFDEEFREVFLGATRKSLRKNLKAPKSGTSEED